MLAELRGRGHEIGWHGYNHDHRMAFLAQRDMEERIQKSLSFFETYSVAGMRTDNFLWSRPLFVALNGRILYDTSFADAFPFVEQGTGCATGVPFWMREGLWQLPTTITPDCFFPESWTVDTCFDVQRRQIDDQIELGGVLHVLAHPEPTISLTPARLELFTRTIEYLDSRRSELWHALPRDLQSYCARPRFEAD